MIIYIIYSKDERSRAENFGLLLTEIGYNILFAPLGVEVGSESWIKEVSNDLKKSYAVILLLTEKSVKDKSVALRIDIALSLNLKIILPIHLDDKLPPKKDWCINRSVCNYQSLLNDKDNLKRILPKYIPIEINRKCFISYSRQNKDFAEKLRTLLILESIKVWKDLQDIAPGNFWDETIAKAIIESTDILFIVTGNSINSMNVADELSFARKNKKNIIPLLFEKVELPFSVHRLQAIDFTLDYDNALIELLKDLKRRI